MKRLIICLAMLSLIFNGCGRSADTVVVGSKNFTESIILAELLAQQIEASTGKKVDRKFNLGGTLICHQALVAGQLDVYPEYTGTSLTAILGMDPQSDPGAVYRTVKSAYEAKFDITLTEPFGFNNTFAILIRGEEARNRNLKTVSDAARYAPEWRAGFGYEFMERPDGFKGFSERYGLKFKESPQVMDLALTYRALADNKVDLIAGNSTDGLIAGLDLFMLADDKNYFPPYEAVALARRAKLNEIPGMTEAISKLGGKISEAEMQRLNALVDVEKRDVKDVVKEFRTEKGF